MRYPPTQCESTSAAASVLDWNEAAAYVCVFYFIFLFPQKNSEGHFSQQLNWHCTH